MTVEGDRKHARAVLECLGEAAETVVLKYANIPEIDDRGLTEELFELLKTVGGHRTVVEMLKLKKNVFFAKQAAAVIDKIEERIGRVET